MNASEFIQIETDTPLKLAVCGDMPEQVHLFDQQSINAINAALAARRPLLVRGEPGTGKTQLARAAAKALGRAYVPYVIQSRTQPTDLLWRFDAVARLADAQLSSALSEPREQLHERLRVENYLHPGPLWWAFDWEDASMQAARLLESPPPQEDNGDCERGSVVLLDEIDNADSDLPNGLLEALGAGRFMPQGRPTPVEAKHHAPLVVITTNDERALPDAFVRRCMVLFLGLPEEPEELRGLLVARGRVHFDDVTDDILHAAVDLLIEDREMVRREKLGAPPGQAEYLDMLRALHNLAPGDDTRQKQTLEQIAAFALKKHHGTGQ